MTLGLAAQRVDPPLVPGSPEWCRSITASKVAAILGLSPWSSPFTVWHELAGWLPHDEEQTAQQSRGHWLENAIAEWWADRHDRHLRPGGCWRSLDRPWQVSSPDRLVFTHRRARRCDTLLEVKTAAHYDDWGPDGTDEVPPYYRVQVIWQLDTLGLPVGHLAVLLPRLQFRSYKFQYDADEAEWIREQVLAFADTLPGGSNETMPDIDGDDSTYETVRRLHPEIDGDDVEVTEEEARRFLDAIQGERDAKAACVEAKAAMGMLMGNAPRAHVNGVVVATRQSKNGGRPYVAAPRTVPDL